MKCEYHHLANAGRSIARIQDMVLNFTNSPTAQPAVLALGSPVKDRAIP